uniref:Integrase core domain containing protein n=1 Tax=Solanum tuberosum TaxID=4113 RepID=M1D946_SOLTU
MFTRVSTDRGTMAPRRKNATKHSSPTASQSEGHNDFESSSSEVQINTIVEDHSPRATRAQTRKVVLQDTLPQSEEGGNSSGSGEESGNQADAVGPEAETGAQIEAGVAEGDDEVTPDDIMVQFVQLREFDPVVRHQLIDCF